MRVRLAAWWLGVSLAVAAPVLGARADAAAARAPAARMTEATLDQEWISLDEETDLAQLERPEAARPIDQHALHVTDGYQRGDEAPLPTEGDGGQVVFVFGTVRPRIWCAQLRVCMVQLKAGETVTDVQSGDTRRWSVDLSMSGLTTYVVIKPRMPNIETDLVVFTDQRAYALTLTSQGTQHMPMVSFEYPEDQRAAWRRSLAAQAQRKAAAPATPEPTPEDNVISVDPKSLHTHYTIDVDNPWFCRRKRNCVDWAPREVLDDGRRTWIKMPATVGARTLPVLFVKTSAGWEQVAYRFKREVMTFFVDRVFNRAELVLGIAGKEGVVTLTREEPR